VTDQVNWEDFLGGSMERLLIFVRVKRRLDPFTMACSLLK
jgi:hypothetical protein